MTEDYEGPDELARRGLTQPRRLDLLERDTRQHAQSIGRLVTIQAEMGNDIKELAEWKMKSLLTEAREDERRTALFDRLDRMEETVNAGLARINSFGSQIFWIIMRTVIPAMVLGVAAILVFKH